MSSNQDFTCIFCSEIFEDKETLQEHFRKHGDPKFNNVTKNKSRFENEQPVGNDKPDDNELVGCDVCDETFKSISKAITHKHKVHPDHDAKYFCPWCGKLFTMKHLYNKHMQSNHIDMARPDMSVHHCDCCNVDFFLPSAMLYHNKFFHRQDTELPAIGHSKKVKTCNQELLQIYYCPFCGEEYDNKVNLHKHMSDDHSDENQSPDEVLRCPLCEAVFYHLDAYELHLSFHSSDDIYSDDNDMAAGITDFSLETVSPIMEKVEEETKAGENQGIDKFLQLVMDESRESGNNDGLERTKSKKHKKHKKSKKAAITLDEFLNMNKDVFGDGLDVQGIEEVPTQHVLKKYKVKKENTKAIPASAIAKLKKQGITIKSNSGPNSPTFKTNRNLIINKTTKNVPSRMPVTPTDKPKPVTSSNEILSKLLNQGNSQIKIVKKASTENFNKDKLDNPVDIQEPTSSNIKKIVSDNEVSSHKSDAEVTNGSDNHEMEQDPSDGPDNNKSDEDTVNHDDSHDTDREDNANLQFQEPVETSNNDDNIHSNELSFTDTDNIKEQETGTSISEAPNNIQKQQHQADINVDDNNDNFENDQGETETNEDIPNLTHDKFSKTCNETVQQGNFQTHNKSLDVLKRLSGLITIKPAPSADNKNEDMETDQLIEHHENDEEDKNNKQLNLAKILENKFQNVSVKKPNIPPRKLDTSTKSIDALKTLNKQLTISPCVTSTTKCSDEGEDDELDSDMHEKTTNKNICNEQDNANFKTPMSVTKQLNKTAKPTQLLDAKSPIHLKNVSKESIKEEDNTKNTINMDILKRLTNVTAKPISKATNSPQVKSNQSADSRMAVTQKTEKSKQIDQDIEIFNIDDSDSDQEIPDEESVHKQIANTSSSSDTKTTASADVLKNLSKNITTSSSDTKTSASADVLKNLSKNITIKSTNINNKNVLNVKKESPSNSSKQISDGDSQSSSNNESKNISQNKQMNINLNHTLKKIGSNISIKSQFPSADSQRHQMLHDEDLDDNFDMSDEGSDSENTNQLKITEMQDEDDDGLHSDDMEYNENAIVQSPHASNSEDETHNPQSDEEGIDDIEKQLKPSTLSKANSASKCLDDFKRNNRELTIKSLNDKNTFSPQSVSTCKKQEEIIRAPSKVSKDMSATQYRANEKQDEDNEVLTKNITQNQSAATSSSSQKVSNQVNTVKTVKTFQSETIIEEITTTVTKTIRTVNQSSQQIARSANATTYRPRLMVSNQQTKPVQGISVRNAPTVGTKIRNAAPLIRPTVVSSKAVGHLVPVRPQNQIVPRQQGVFRPNAPGPSNIRKISPQPNVRKPLMGKPLKISPLAMNQTLKRAPENVTGHFSCFKKPKESIIPGMDSFDDDNDDSAVNYSSTSSSRSDFSTTATKIVKGKSVVTATQARSEQHSEQHISKLNNMAGLKIVRTSAKQSSQSETKNNMCAAKRTTLDAIEKLQKQGLLVKKPRIEEPEEEEHYNSDSEGGEENYEENE